MSVHVPAQVEDRLASTGGENASKASARSRLLTEYEKVGDMRTTRLDETFTLVYLVADSIMDVTTQDGQIEVFTNAAGPSATRWFFVVEVIVPALRSVPPGEVGRVFTLDPTMSGSRPSTTWSSRLLRRITGWRWTDGSSSTRRLTAMSCPRSWQGAS